MGASVLAEMHLIPVAFLLLGATSLIESSGCPSSGGWIPLDGHCYLLGPTKMNWFQAQQFCWEKGGYLAEILSQSEQTNVAALLNTGKFKFYWIGLNDMAFEGKFEWQHSFTPLGNYTNWIPGVTKTVSLWWSLITGVGMIFIVTAMNGNQTKFMPCANIKILDHKSFVS